MRGYAYNFAAMEASGAMTEEQILSMRDTVSDTIDTMGSSLVKSMGIAYAVSCDTAAGVDIDKVQTSYLWSAGGRMVAMALLMGVATVLVGFLVHVSVPESDVTCEERYLDRWFVFLTRRWIIFPLHL